MILEVNKLRKEVSSGESKLVILDDVSFNLLEGQSLAITGPSGSGKSTFLHMLALLEEPNKGRIYLSKRDTGKMSENEKDKVRREKISIIFQNNNLLNDFTALENILMPLYIKGDINQRAKDKGLKILSEVKLNNRANHFPSELSGGEQQRVAIARSIISDTNLILADEPTGNLDRKTSKNVFNYFKNLQKKNKAILFATHNRELANMADYKLSISNSKLLRSNGKK